MDEISDRVKAFILTEYLPGENPEALTGSTPLISGGILDSIGTLKLVAFLEDTWGIEVQPLEVDVDYLNTVGTIAELVTAKLAALSRPLGP